MTEDKQIRDGARDIVSQTYTAILTDEADRNAKRSDKLVSLVTYDADQISNIPVDAVENSFGCGNPLAFSGVKSGDTIVDLGSGAGIDLLVAAEIVGENGHVIGIDMTDAMIDRARKNIAEAGLKNTEVRQGLIEDMPVDNDTADWIISNCVINLSPEKDRVFSEIYRVLKPGGKMQISDVVMDDGALPAWLRNNACLHSACISGAIAEQAYIEGLESVGLVHAHVKERMTFDASTLRGLLKSGEVPEIKQIIDDLGAEGDDVLDQIVNSLNGKVHSVKIFAEKPFENQRHVTM